MCGKTPNGIKTGYSIGVGNDWNKDIPMKVYPRDGNVEEEYEKMLDRFRAERAREYLRAECAGKCFEQKSQAKETVNHPDHYNSKGIEVMDVIRAFDLSFSLGNVIKYVLRAGKKHKETYLEDLKKAKWYLDEEIRHVEPIPRGILETGK